MSIVNSLRFKITVLFVGALGLVLLAYRGLVFSYLSGALYKESNNVLILKAREISGAIHAFSETGGGDKKAFHYGVRRVIRGDQRYPVPRQMGPVEYEWIRKTTTLDLARDYLNFSTLDGRAIASSRNLTRELRPLFQKYATRETAEGGQVIADAQAKESSLHIKIITLPVSFGDQGQYLLQVGSAYTPVIHVLRKRLYHLALSVPLILLLAFLVSHLFAARILRPVKEITKAARNISRTNLSARVQVQRADSEMKYLADAFNDMIMRLEQSFNYIDKFSYHVAHELKSPLTIIKGESELALRKERDVQEYKRALSVNLEEAERLIEMIDDILLLAKLDWKREALEIVRFDLTELLCQICEETRALASRKEIAVRVKIPPERIEIDASRKHLMRLFRNIVDNAVKFTPRGGAVDIAAAQANGMVSVRIQDNGIGISGNDLPNIFKEFFRGGSSQAKAAPGHGLGLGIAKAIARLHNGDITVESSSGKGSCFTVILPTATSPA